MLLSRTAYRKADRSFRSSNVVLIAQRRTTQSRLARGLGSVTLNKVTPPSRDPCSALADHWPLSIGRYDSSILCMVRTAAGRQIKSLQLTHRYSSTRVARDLWAALLLAVLAGEAAAADKPVAVDHAANAATRCNAAS